MAKDKTNISFDRGLTTFFVETLAPDADLVYRFSFAITLNQVAANDCLMKTYESLLGDLAALERSTPGGVRKRLLQACWEVYQSEQADEGDVDESSLGRFFASLPVFGRACLFLVDVVGLLPSEAAEVMGSNESEIRKNLATARKALVKFS